MQRAEPDVVSVVYSGDVDASKDEIIQKVKVCIYVLLTLSALKSYLPVVEVRHRAIPRHPSLRLAPEAVPR